MAQYVENSLVYYLVIHKNDYHLLSAIRHWSTIKLAYDNDEIWIKDFDYAQINSTEIKSIPQKTIYYSKEGKLYLINSLLPEKNVPSLLWTAINRAISVTLPKYNFNYFGIQEKIEISLIPSSQEVDATVSLVSLKNIHEYLKTAPQIRLTNKTWVLINSQFALIMGTPLLPISGNDYWEFNEFLIPAGYQFNFPILSKELANTIIDSDNSIILWSTENEYQLIPQSNFRPLSLSSFRNTLKENNIKIS